MMPSGQIPLERERWSRAFWNKEITYAEWAGKDVAMWREKNVTRGEIKRYIDALSPMPGAWESLVELHRQGHTLGVISGSLDVASGAGLSEVAEYFHARFPEQIDF